MAAFTIRDLTFSYPLKEKPALRNVNLQVQYGEFITICGKSGCGKSTLLRNLKTALAPHGTKTGEILFYGVPLEKISQRNQSGRIGFVLQNPDNQVVTDKVWHELAFGLESLGHDTKTIRLRVAEMASFFGIQTWFMKNVNELSGGQKQLLNLAAVMVMQPDVLILDEPTSQLDPIAASNFLETVKKINRELGTTIIITEHRLDDVLPMADRAIVMDEGEIIIDDTPANAGALLAAKKHDMFAAMPAPLQTYATLYEKGIGRELECPVTVRDGSRWLTKLLAGTELKTTALPFAGENDRQGEEPVIKVKDVWFKYSKEGQDVVKDLSMEVYKGELYCIVGGNGTGKTTTLTLISGINTPYRGKIHVQGRDLCKYKEKELFSGLMGVLPQNPQSLFVEKTVELDLLEILEDKKDSDGKKLAKEEKTKRVREMAELVEIDGLLDRHPYDLSGGEQQRAALAKILLLDPQILLLDEPTKGIDNHFKAKLASILKKLTEKGITIVMVSHDVEFCGCYGDRCAMFFAGNIVTTNAPNKFFSGNSFYTTAANRMSRHIFENAITAADVAKLCLTNLEGKNDGDGKDPKDGSNTPHTGEDKSPEDNEYDDFDDRGIPAGELIETEEKPASKISKKAKNTLAFIITIVLAALTLTAGITILDDRKYYFVSLMIVVYSMIPMFALFERKKPAAREIIVIAVMIAIAVAGRAAFFMVPQFKPVMALVIISGACLGSQAGFLVGTMSAFVSNFLFGQGPWTPWQMIAFGAAGLIAGLLVERGILKEKKKQLIIYGGFAAFFIYGGLVDLWTIFGMSAEPSWAVAATVYGLAVPFNLIHAAATVIFLYFLAEPFIDKLDRIKIKYGLKCGGSI